MSRSVSFSLFFSDDTAPTEIYTLSLHDALPICSLTEMERPRPNPSTMGASGPKVRVRRNRSEEHTSELQSHVNLVCRLLLEKKKATNHPQSQQDSRGTALIPPLTLAVRNAAPDA